MASSSNLTVMQPFQYAVVQSFVACAVVHCHSAACQLVGIVHAPFGGHVDALQLRKQLQPAEPTEPWVSVCNILLHNHRTNSLSLRSQPQCRCWALFFEPTSCSKCKVHQQLAFTYDGWPSMCAQCLLRHHHPVYVLCCIHLSQLSPPHWPLAW